MKRETYPFNTVKDVVVKTSYLHTYFKIKYTDRLYPVMTSFLIEAVLTQVIYAVILFLQMAAKLKIAVAGFST